jgi:hypothetical protein
VQRAFGYTKEDIEQYMVPLIKDKKDPIGSMGHDQPIAVLSTRPRSLFHYFKQHFAQVTNPPIDALREKIVTATFTWIGPQGNPVHTGRGHAKRVWLNHPMIDGAILKQLAEKLKVTGSLNQQTLDALGINAPPPAPDYSKINALFDGGPLSGRDSTAQVEAVRHAQRVLAESGFYAGPHNGLPSATLTASIKEWQLAQGLPQTGKLDSRTLAGLGIVRN